MGSKDQADVAVVTCISEINKAKDLHKQIVDKRELLIKRTSEALQR